MNPDAILSSLANEEMNQDIQASQEDVEKRRQ
jgi:hypothetical protein